MLTSNLTVRCSRPGSPMPLFSVAFAVNVCLPDGSSLLSAAPSSTICPPAAVVVALATSVAPSKTCTTTSVSSLAVPLNDGVRLFDGDVGRSIVTTGASVLTSKATVPLLPSGFAEPALLGRLRRERVFARRQFFAQRRPPRRPFPARRSRCRLATSVAPSNTCTTTSVSSLAVPENAGLVLFEGVVGADRHGRRLVFTSKDPLPAFAVRVRRARSSPSPSP